MIDIKSMLIPYPQKVSEVNGIAVIGEYNSKVNIVCDKYYGEVFNHAVYTLKEKLLNLAAIECIDDCRTAFVINIKIDKDYDAYKNIKNEEAYYIDIKKEGALICAYDEAGVFYGVLTLCSLLFKENEKACLPIISVTDWPDFPDRTQFIECRYGSDFMTKKQWFDMIDYFSEMKFNGITIGLYGCWPVQYDKALQEYLFIPIKKYPQLKTPRDIKYYSVKNRQYVIKRDVLPVIFEEDFFGELISYGKKRNIKVVPMFNSLGHNTLIPREFPRLSAKDEKGNDTGFGFCTESDETFQFMCDVYDEIIDRYLISNEIDSIVIGLDEVIDSMGIDKSDLKKKFSYLCRCEKCRQFEEKELMIRYIIKICKYLKSRGMKNIYIYQDMLFYNYDVINEELKERFIKEDIYDVVVIDWWSYDVGDTLFLGRAKDVTNIFRSTIKPMTGYFHWAFPTEVNQNIKECVEIARDLNFEGVRAYTGFDYCYDKNFLYQADVSWNTSMLDCEDFEARYSKRLCPENPTAAYTALVCMKDIMSNDRKDNFMHSVFDYYMHSYIKSDLPYPRCYPGEVYSTVLNDEEKYVCYLETVYGKAKAAYDIFKTQCSQTRLCDIWQLSAKQYYVTADEFLTLTRFSKNYASGNSNEFNLLYELERLISNREELMSDGETIKISGNSYHYLRDMTIIRQYLVDLKVYVKDMIAKGKKPKLDIINLDYLKSNIYDFFR